MSRKIEIDQTITVTIGDQSFQLTVTEARKLREQLDAAIPQLPSTGFIERVIKENRERMPYGHPPPNWKTGQHPYVPPFGPTCNIPTDHEVTAAINSR
jgi:hypothetical protein